MNKVCTIAGKLFFSVISAVFLYYIISHTSSNAINIIPALKGFLDVSKEIPFIQGKTLPYKLFCYNNANFIKSLAILLWVLYTMLLFVYLRPKSFYIFTRSALYIVSLTTMCLLCEKLYKTPLFEISKLVLVLCYFTQCVIFAALIVTIISVPIKTYILTFIFFALLSIVNLSIYLISMVIFQMIPSFLFIPFLAGICFILRLLIIVLTMKAIGNSNFFIINDAK